MVKNKKRSRWLYLPHRVSPPHHHHCGGERRREELEVAMEICEGDLRRGRERRRRRRGGDVNGVEGDEAQT
uniref:Uncharacterized protein n=1 Tax=Brassica oleracea var. oleracea TaxID=109376 RepID=A0A0D3BYZ1_BRAOL